MRDQRSDRLIFQAANRNCFPIASILDNVLPDNGTILELGSGSGQHAVFFQRRYPQLSWQTSDIADSNLSSIRSWVIREKLNNSIILIFKVIYLNEFV